VFSTLVALTFLLSLNCTSENKKTEKISGLQEVSAIAECPDRDGDGCRDKSCGGNDCDDNNPLVHPNAYDICGDELDNDCDGIVDNPPTPELDLPEFIFGTSFGGGAELDYLEQMGIHWVRNDVNWNDVMPEITDINLDLHYVMTHPEMVDDLIQSADWSIADSRIGDLIKHGMNPIVVVGHGYKWRHALYNGEWATPDRIGKSTYLAYMYLYSRAVVERYDGDGYLDADGIVVKFWQIENELNQAMLTAAWGWRAPDWMDGFTSAWADWNFLDMLLWVLSQAVKNADPEAITVINLHSDIPDAMCRFFGIPTWREAAAMWRDYADIVGFDSYPNYLVPEPILGEQIGEKTKLIQEASCGKPTMILETDYTTGPPELAFTAESQAEYIYEAFWSSYDAGAKGFLKLAAMGGDSTSVEITDEDIANILDVRRWWLQNNLVSLMFWALGNFDYLPHFLDVVMSVEGYWGMIKPDGELKPAYFVMKDIADFLNSQKTARTPKNGKNGSP